MTEILEEEVDSTPEISPDDPLSIAESIVPQFGEDDPKTRYLAFRASGFTVREAAHMVQVRPGTVLLWRQQFPEVEKYEKDIQLIRQRFGANFAYAEFLRNFRLVMMQDSKVLLKQALAPTTLTQEDKSYLSRIRQYYTPQQMEVVRGALAGGAPNSGLGPQFNFTQVVMNLARGTTEPEEPTPRPPKIIRHAELLSENP
jgi:hypothetical protein